MYLAESFFPLRDRSSSRRGSEEKGDAGCFVHLAFLTLAIRLAFAIVEMDL